MEENHMRFTCNIATYNQLPILKLILSALENQPFKDFEIIVCDDGSSDGTKEFMATKPYKYFWQEDIGFRLAKSKNNGIRAAEGDYFISLEADVIPNKNMLLEYNMWAKPDTVIYGVRHDIEGIPDTYDSEVLDTKIVSRDFRMDDLRNLANIVKPWRACSGCNFLIPTSKLKEIGGWNENFKHYGVDDYEVCLRLYNAGCKFVPCIGAYGYHIKHDLRGTIDENVKLLEEAERKLGL